ncbi:hypothetical protein OH809_35605 [Streptomyces sp. NBC_00873]|nr:hypothetical protein OH809_35605 [Streptomyces sp. NBC_00873]WTA42574.1 hypothetical protein OH821_08105 [Streptomyces sp. NBC_00842]
MGHDALGASVGEDDPALDRVLGVAGAPGRTGEGDRAVVKGRHRDVRGALIGLPAPLPAAPQ